MIACSSSRKGMLKIVLILLAGVLLVSTISISFYLANSSRSQAPTELLSESGNIPSQGPTIQTQEGKIAALDSVLVKQIVTGEISNPPEIYNVTRRDVLKNYVKDCGLIKEDEMKADCYELYYLNNEENYYTMKQDCLGLEGQKLRDCLDKYYLELSVYSDSFCSKIENQETSNGCGIAIE